MQNKQDLRYRIGYAIEVARQRLPATPAAAAEALKKVKVPAKADEAKGRLGKALEKAQARKLDDASSKVLDAFLTVGAGTILTRVLSIWPGRKRPGLFRLLRAGAAGAAASFLAELTRPAISGTPAETDLEEELTDLLLSGAGRGLLYAAIVEPRVPGHPLLRGTTYAALEYALTPWGGLEGLTGTAAPHRKIPVLSVLLQNRGEEEQFLEHLAFGIALALLYDR